MYIFSQARNILALAWAREVAGVAWRVRTRTGMDGIICGKCKLGQSLPHPVLG